MAWTVDGLVYTTRIKLTIDHTKIGAALESTSIPVVVKLTGGRLNFAHANADGFDIRFTKSDGTTLQKYDRERHDNVNSLGAYHTLVPLPANASTVDTIFHMYFRTADTPDGADPTSVWDANFIGVWHMGDNPDTSHIADTIAGNTGHKMAANQPIQVSAAAEVGFGQYFDHTTHILATDLGMGDRTFEALVYIEDFNDEGGVNARILIDRIDASNALQLALNPPGMFAWSVTDAGVEFGAGSEIYAANAWYYVVGTYDQATHAVVVYVNDSFVPWAAAGYGVGTIDGIYFGVRSDLQGHFKGIEDEVRISNMVRPRVYITATYSSLFDTLLTYGAEERAAGGVASNMANKLVAAEII